MLDRKEIEEQDGILQDLEVHENIATVSYALQMEMLDYGRVIFNHLAQTQSHPVNLPGDFYWGGMHEDDDGSGDSDDVVFIEGEGIPVSYLCRFYFNYSSSFR